MLKHFTSNLRVSSYYDYKRTRSLTFASVNISNTKCNWKQRWAVINWNIIPTIWA